MILLSFCHLFLTVLQPDTLVNIANEFHNISGYSSIVTFIERHKNSENLETKAFVIGAQANQAVYQSAPWEKIGTFNNAFQEINNLAEIEPENIYVRYIRWLIQINAPNFLREKKILEEDILFLKGALNQDFYNFKL